jgi:acyl-CoA thioesterase FadM
MTTVHYSEANYGDEVIGRTWVNSFRRGLLCTRQIRLTVGGRPLASSTQEWAHVSTKNGVMRAARANPEMVAAFSIEGPDENISLPEFTEDLGSEHVFEFQVWHTWMDPLAHANHPVYVDWAEEALARLLGANGINPALVEPVAERAKWRVGAMAPDTVKVTTQRIGRTQDGSVVCRHTVHAEQSGPAATVTTVRRLVDGDTDRLARAVQ